MKKKKERFKRKKGVMEEWG